MTNPHYLDKARELLSELIPADTAWVLLVQDDYGDDPELANMRILSTEDDPVQLARGLRNVAKKLVGDA
jgi:hypothetical protein